MSLFYIFVRAICKTRIIIIIMDFIIITINFNIIWNNIIMLL